MSDPFTAQSNTIKQLYNQPKEVTIFAKEIIEMINEEKSTNGESIFGEDFVVRITNPMLYDRLHTLSAEYSLSVELLVNIAVKRLVSDIDFVRDLRIGKVELE